MENKIGKDILVPIIAFNNFLVSLCELFLENPDIEEEILSKLKLENVYIDILKQTGGLFGNPGMMCAELFFFIVLQKEAGLNVDNIIEQYIYSVTDEKDRDYTRHIRNAIAHGHIYYNNGFYVTFEDVQSSYSITFECKRVGLLVRDLVSNLTVYCNNS